LGLSKKTDEKDENDGFELHLSRAIGGGCGIHHRLHVRPV